MSSQMLCLCVEIELLLQSLLNKWKVHHLLFLHFFGFFVLFSVVLSSHHNILLSHRSSELRFRLSLARLLVALAC